MKNKKAAMEMSVGTIVTIVLLMSVLVLGIFLVQKVFSSGSNAIDQIDTEVQNQINQLFSDGDEDLVILPPSKTIELKKGQTPPAGFAFSIKNPSDVKQVFNYETTLNNELCPESVLDKIGMIGGENEIELGPSQKMGNPTAVRFSIPEDVPECTFSATLQVSGDQGYSDSRRVDISITSGGFF